MSGLRLLYIDDDPALARLVRRRFERRGYAVEVAATGENGAARAAQGGVDVVALDHTMPGQDGLATLAQIRALPDPPPVVYVTATGESSVAVAALKAGAADYVVKDVGGFGDLLDAAVAAAIEGARLRRQALRAEQEVRDARDRFEALAAEREMLLREVNHRVGNSLQLVAAFLHMQAASAGGEIRDALAEANRRVLAVAQVHRRLYASDDVTTVALHHYLEGLVEDLRQSTVTDGTADGLSLCCDAIEVDPDAAVTVGVIVTELVINAVKYAYPDGRGPIRVTLDRPEAGRCRLRVEDDGVGGGLGPATGPRGSGIGRSIIKAMATKLSATVEDHRASGRGTRVEVEFALVPREPAAGA